MPKFREGRAWTVVNADNPADVFLLELENGSKAVLLFSEERLAQAFAGKSYGVLFLDGPEKVLAFLEEQGQREVGFVLADQDSADLPFGAATKIETVINGIQKS